MSIATENPATRGKVIAVKDRSVVFVPRGPNYELHLQPATQSGGALSAPGGAV